MYETLDNVHTIREEEKDDDSREEHVEGRYQRIREEVRDKEEEEEKDDDSREEHVEGGYQRIREELERMK